MSSRTIYDQDCILKTNVKPTNRGESNVNFRLHNLYYSLLLFGSKIIAIADPIHVVKNI